MSAKVNLKTIAKDLGLSIGTVSRVLNGRAEEYRISKETIATVIDHAEKIGYSPNLIAKGLQASKTFTIGLMIPDIANPFFALMAKNIEKAASNANYSILLVDAEESAIKEKKQILNMIGRKVDGIIAAPVGTLFNHFSEITRQNIPLVFIDRYSTKIDIPFITSDNYNGAKSATELLIQNGHKRIALLKGDESIEPINNRLQGYLDALRAANIPVDQELVKGNEFSTETGYEEAMKVLQSLNPPTAIFAMSNQIGLGVMQALKELKLTIPNDISFIIFDDQPYVSFLNPPITTVKQDIEKIGTLATEFIIQKIDNPQSKLSSMFIDTDVIERKSIKNIS